jgi:hypothetical protein
MNDTPESWPALSYLESLRPGPDEAVELAVLAAYSADLASIGAALLALAGKDSDAGKGSATDFADAVERLRGKVRIVIQRGRLAKMWRTPRIAAVLDQFVREVDFDEARHSWHPKVALMRTRSDEGETRWRLWVGSRNLTECVNRDIGLLLVSGGQGARQISGADALARSLADRAELKGVRSASLASTIAKVAWRAPVGVTVEALRWSSGLAPMEIPTPPPRTEDIIVVSPFVDKAFLAAQMSPGREEPRRTLLTTMREIERVGPSLRTFDNLLALDGPEYPIADPEPAEGALAPAEPQGAPEEEQQIGRGLHAKLLFWRVGRTRTLWLGSANATRRAWSGRNAEATLELRITEGVEAGLRALIGSARCIPVPEREFEPDAATLEEETLERARAQVAARWGATLAVEDDGLRVEHTSAQYPRGPHPDEEGIVLQIGALNGDLRVWPRAATEISLGSVPRAERTEFVRLRVSLGEKGISWLQRAPADPPFGVERDRAAFVRLLGARGFLLWLASLLADDGREAEGDWTIEQVAERLGAGVDESLATVLPTLEEMLAAWARDRTKFREIERRVSDYLPAVLEQARQEDPEAIAMLCRFEDLWGKIRSGLIGAGGGRRR